MDQLIDTINKLQDVFQALGEGDSVSLPQIAVVGAQVSDVHPAAAREKGE